jgi:biopolymer transport protein ExbD
MAVRIKRKPQPGGAMPIAPMIDVVFLMLIYFIVTSTLEKQEADISFQLPGVAEQSESLDLPDEQIIEINSEGQVTVNEYAYDSPGVSKLVELTAMLTRFKQASEANKIEAIVTIAPDDAVRHQIVVRVMDACSTAGIDAVNFALGDE